MQLSTAVPPDEAAQTLQSIRATRDAARERIPPYWFGLVVFGALTMASAWLLEPWDGLAVALFWLVAGPLGWLLVERRQRAELLATGAADTGRPYARTAATFTLSAVALGAIGGALREPEVAAFGIPLAIAAAYYVFAWVDRRPGHAVWATAVVALVGLAVLIGAGTGGAFGLYQALGLRFVIEGFQGRREGKAA